MIVDRRDITRQPQRVLPIDWSDPITDGMKSVLIPSLGLRDAVSGESWGTVGVAAKSTGGVKGVAKDTRTGSGSLVLLPRVNLATAAQTHLLVLSYESGDNLFSGLFSCGSQSAARSFDIVGAGSVFSVNNASPISALPNTAPFPASVLVLTGDATGSSVYFNGQLVLSGGAAPVAQSNARIVLFGDRYGDGTYTTKGLIYLYVGWTRALSKNDGERISKNPWCFLQGRERETFSASPQPGVAAALEGAALSVTTATGALSTAIPLSGAAVSVVAAAGGIVTGIPLSAAALSQAIAAGTLVAQIKLDSAALAQVAASAGLSSGILLAGAAQAQTLASGTLAGGAAGLAGDAQMTATAVATLTTRILLSGSAAAEAGVSGTLTTAIPLSAAALNQAMASGTLSVPILLAGHAEARVLASGDLNAASPVLPTVAYRLAASVQRLTTLHCADTRLTHARAADRRLATLTTGVRHA